MSDTPRTDAYVLAETGIAFRSRSAEFMRQLERENAALLDALKTLYVYARPFMTDEWQNNAIEKAASAITKAEKESA